MMSAVPTSDETAELAARLRLAVTRLARQLRQTSDSDLSPTQSAVLATLANHGPVTLGELAELERVASPTITKVTGILQERGLVEKVTDPSDRRYVRVELTADGRGLVERGRARKTAWLARQLQDLAPEELEQLAAAAEVLEHLTARKAAR
jgi:DNA-binding MarR family transcriptional regulator